MATQQEQALNEMRHKYGMSAFTHHHLHYCMVGFVRAEKRVTGMGATWQEALDALGRKGKRE
jgi:hypothetical protein